MYKTIWFNNIFSGIVTDTGLWPSVDINPALTELFMYFVKLILLLCRVLHFYFLASCVDYS